MQTTSRDECSVDAQGRAIVEALGGHWHTRGGMCRCPAHADETPSLSVRPGQKSLLFHCFAGCEPNAIIRSLRTMRLYALQASAKLDRTLPLPPSMSLSPLAARIWSEARPFAGSPASRYLQSRGILLVSNALRFHSRPPRGRAPLTSFQPAMITAVRDDAGLVGVHRTFLDTARDCLADLPVPKSALGRLSGGAVRLAPVVRGSLGLAEGVETALSASQLFDRPCWATLGTERFRQVSVPATVRRLILFLDNDAGGRRAELLARETHAGAPFSIEAMYPENPDEDWNDVLRRQLGIVRRTTSEEESKAVA